MADELPGLIKTSPSTHLIGTYSAAGREMDTDVQYPSTVLGPSAVGALTLSYRKGTGSSSSSGNTQSRWSDYGVQSHCQPNLCPLH